MKDRQYYGLLSQLCIITAFLAHDDFGKWVFVGCAVVYMVLSYLSKSDD